MIFYGNVESPSLFVVALLWLQEGFRKQQHAFSNFQVVWKTILPSIPSHHYPAMLSTLPKSMKFPVLTLNIVGAEHLLERNPSGNQRAYPRVKSAEGWGGAESDFCFFEFGNAMPLIMGHVWGREREGGILEMVKNTRLGMAKPLWLEVGGGREGEKWF